MNGNANEAMRDLASRLWGRFLRERVLEEMTHEVNAFRAVVVTNNGNGTLTVRRPFESGNLTLRAAASMSGAKAGDQVLILGIGEKRKALSNAFVLCKTDLSTFVSEETVLAAFPVDTASGSPANFPDGADDIPVADISVAIGLSQSGSGTPSPTNVRTITPWTGLTLSHSGADTSDPEELAISWADEAGNVWAGTLDVTTGVLTELYYDASGEALGMVVTGNTPNATVQARFKPNLQQFSASNADIISSHFSSANGSGQSGMIARVNLSDGAWIYLNIPQSQMEGTTTDDVQAWAAAKKPVILLKRTTPVTWQLHPRVVKTLLSENNFWADTGAVTVLYRADPTLYIQKKLGA